MRQKFQEHAGHGRYVDSEAPKVQKVVFQCLARAQVDVLIVSHSQSLLLEK